MTLAQKRKRVGYKLDGSALNKTELMQITNEAEIRYNKKEFVTHEKARKQSNKW